MEEVYRDYPVRYDRVVSCLHAHGISDLAMANGLGLQQQEMVRCLRTRRSSQGFLDRALSFNTVAATSIPRFRARFARDTWGPGNAIFAKAKS